MIENIVSPKNRLRIGILTNYLNNTDGVAKHIFDLLTGLKQIAPDIFFTVISGGGNFVDVFNENGIGTVVLEDFSHQERNPVNLCRSILSVYDIVQKHQLTILHSHNHYHANIAQTVKFLGRVKTVQTNHGILPGVGLIPHFAADKLIAINQHIVDYFLNVKHFPVSKFDFIRCGIPEETAASRKNDSPVLFIAAGRLVKEKGFDLYIRAAAEVKKQTTIPIEFLLAGTGKEFTALSNLNIESDCPVEVLGDVRNLPELFNRTHVLINPSRSTSEGFPRTIVEAVFRDNFLITSLFNGVECDFDKNNDGFAFEVDNEQGLIECILRHLTNREEAANTASSFKQKAQELFSRQIMAEKTLSLYEKLLG